MLDQRNFALYTVYRNSTSQGTLWETAGEDWTALWGRLLEVATPYPSVVIGDSAALGGLTADFRLEYPEDTNIYVTGSPNMDTLLAEPRHFGWFKPPLLTQSEIALIQGVLDLGSFAYVMALDWWGWSTLFDITMVLEATIGAVMAGLAAMSYWNEKYFAWMDASRIFVAGAELLAAAGYFAEFIKDTQYLDHLIVGMIVHPINAVVNTIYWLLQR